MDDYEQSEDYDANRPEPVVGDAPPTARTFLSNKVYDVLKFVALVLLPAIGTLYFGVAAIWGLPKADEVVGTVLVVDTFLGVVLGVTNQNYKNSDARFDGQMDLVPDHENDVTDARLNVDPAAIATKDEVVIKVKRHG